MASKLKLDADLEKALTNAGFRDLGEVRLTDEGAMKRKIGADRTNELVEWFGNHTETPVADFVAYTLAEEDE